MENQNTISISQAYETSAERIFELIKSGALFELTGADEINFDFWEGGSFHLLFKNRGHIDGTFEQIIPQKKILLNWNVEGFERLSEHDTKAILLIEGNATLTVEHSGIKNAEATSAKKKAWIEILRDLNKRIKESISEY
jgi:uncharacterized protein YndB with AHSA1/START domain